MNNSDPVGGAPQGNPNPRTDSPPEHPRTESIAAKADSSALSASNSRARFQRPRKPSRKMAAWVRFYTDPTSPAFLNKTRASQLAGYRGRQGSSAWGVQGHRNSEHPVLQQTIVQALDDAGCTVEHGSKRLREATDAVRRRYFMGKDGNIVCSAPEPDQPIRLRATLAVFALRREAQPHAQMDAPSWEALDDTESLPADGNPQQITALEKVVKQMPASDRMLVRHEMGLYRRILKEIEEKQAEEVKREKS